ncbi:MAG: hypothetical protein K2K46_12665 [Lachnospiraceae bacterium]|nr:hypothetical protein [Lachnospiraceae bacterium]
MRIGGIGNVYPTYVYNPNTVTSKSMNKLSRISDDVLDKKVDYSQTATQENQNPLKKGQTIDFEGILARQMQEGQNRAAKIMPNGLEPEKSQDKAAEVKTSELTAKSTAENTKVNLDAENAESGNNANVTQMQRAIQAYEMFMTA